MNYFTVLEIGSGSFKLHKEEQFSLRFESSLGKGIKNGQLSKEALEISKNSLEKHIVAFLNKEGIALDQVLVFATSAVRQAMKDPNGSGEYFIKLVESYGFTDIRVFTEENESHYAAWAVLEELGENYSDFLMLDTGGASHQLVEFQDKKIIKDISTPLGSHSDLAHASMPNFTEQGFSKDKAIAIIGTTGYIINNIKNISTNKIKELIETLEKLSIEDRREFLKTQISDESLYELLIDFRLKVMPNALRIIYNCVDNLNSSKFLFSASQAMNYVSKYGFKES